MEVKNSEAEPALIPGAKDTDGWSQYESRRDSFKISFPPTPIVADEFDEQGRKNGSRYYNPEPVTSARISLTLIASDLGVVVTDEKSTLYNSWLEGLMSPDRNGKSANKVLQKEFAFGNTFGMEVIVDRGDYRFHGWVVCIGSKFYQLAAGSGTPAVVTPAEYADGAKWTRKFFDSFQLIVKPVSQPDPLLGSVENGVYTNSALNYSIEIPETWTKEENKRSEEMEAAALETVGNNNRQIKKTMAEEFKKAKTVFRYYKHGTGGRPDVSFSSTLHKTTPGSTLEASVLSTRQMLAATSLKPVLTPTKYIYFGKVKAGVIQGQYSYLGLSFKQKMYMLQRSDYYITFVITYMDEMDLLEIDQKMQTLVFK